MNKIFLLLILILPIIHSTAALAKMYKWVDADGNISYSDQPPFKGAEQLEPPAISTTPAVNVPKKAAKAEDDEDEKTTKYSFFKIMSPENDATIRDNNGNFSLSMSSRPAIDTAAGHYISILIDGKVAVKKSSTTASLSNIDRGTHKISAQIKSRDNKVIRSTPIVTVHLYRQIVPRAKPSP